MNDQGEVMINGMKNILLKPMLAVCMGLVVSFCPFNSAFAESALWNPGDVLREYLIDNYPWEEIEVSKVRITGRNHDKAPDRIVIEKGPLGNAVFSFIFRDNQRSIVRANVRAYGWVVMSKRAFKRRHVLQNDDIYLGKMNVRKMPGSSVKTPARILGKSLKRSISANIPIVENMIEMSRTVARGKSVVLLLDHDGLSIKAAGKIKEKGYVGMPVRAINISSKKEVNGVLLDENTVKVEL